MISLKLSKSSTKTEDFLRRAQKAEAFAALGKYGALGVAALSAATPQDSGRTADAWSYEIISRKGYYSIVWTNADNIDGITVAVLLQYGHATGTGGYVQGRDYIMPAIRPIFDQIASDLWKEVTK